MERDKDPAKQGPLAAAPTVSVLLTAYDPRYLQAAVESVLCQTSERLELLILDDSPGDVVRQLVTRFDDDRIRYFPSEQLGVARNHHRGLVAARGSWMAIINHDDEWEPTLLEELTAGLRRAPGAVVAFSDHWVMRGDGTLDYEASERSSARWRRASLAPGLHEPFRRLAVFTRCVPIAQCAVWDRRAVEAIPVWAADRYDYWLQVHLSLTGRGAVYVPRRLARFREHARNLGSDRGLPRRLQAEVFYRHLLVARGLGRDRGAVLKEYGMALVDFAKWPLWRIARQAVLAERQEMAQVEVRSEDGRI